MSTTAVEDTYSWWFRASPTVACALKVFVADANPSSGTAHYEVYAGTARLGGFDIVQAEHRGEWVDAGSWRAAGGVLHAELTDQADYPGARHHVTASAASLACG